MELGSLKERSVPSERSSWGLENELQTSCRLSRPRLNQHWLPASNPFNITMIQVVGGRFDTVKMLMPISRVAAQE